MKKVSFGEDGRGNAVENVVLTNKKGMEVTVSTLGAIIVSVVLPDKNGTMTDVVLGYDTAAEYLENTCYFGALIGRNGNRIANASFELNGVSYQLEKNDGENNLHSGKNGMHQKIFTIDSMDETAESVVLSCVSPDMEQDFPGTMKVSVRYTLSEDGTLELAYQAVSDKDTIANITNHSYFNLAGHNTGSAVSQEISIASDAFTPVGAVGLIPTGELTEVAATPMDFRTFKVIGAEIDAEYDQLKYCGGYDHNFAVRGEGYRLMAEAKCAENGIQMQAFTDCPGVQFYAGNFIAEHKGKGGCVYGKRHGYCFESQYFPNAMNCSAFASPVLKAGETYTSRTAYRFFV